MEVRELRLQTGLSQSKFAGMFDIPLSTLKDWEQERRNPPVYVINMMKTILQYIDKIAVVNGRMNGKHIIKENFIPIVRMALTKQLEEEATYGNYCPKCGHKILQQRQLYCGYCGQRIKQNG